jgi:hypothetical protein
MDGPLDQAVRVWPAWRGWHAGAWRGHGLLRVAGRERPRELHGLGRRAASGEGRLG